MVFIYLIGEITSNGLGYLDGTGPSYKKGARPGSGGGHGGNGGRASYRFRSSLAYDSIYTPKDRGSGGGGGSGGGIIYINVTDMFRLEGNVRANGLGSNSGGGAGGTVLVRTKHFDGMGTIETRGGVGAGSGVSGIRGGGGGGGRIAVYHSGVSTFIGNVEAFGGDSVSEKGGPGTVYIQDEGGNVTRRQLIIDNGHSGTSSKIDEIVQVQIGGNSISPYFDVPSYITLEGIVLRTSGPPMCGSSYHHRLCRSRSGQLSNLFSGSAFDGFYYTSSHRSDISYALPYPLTIDHMKIFPQCSYTYRSEFRVQAYLRNTLVYSQASWKDTRFCSQGQYLRVDIQKEVDKVGQKGFIHSIDSK